jgi:predicted enzyme related to lactoylglutathione lyase
MPARVKSIKTIDKNSSKIEELGGKVVGPKHAVPGVGYFTL